MSNTFGKSLRQVIRYKCNQKFESTMRFSACEREQAHRGFACTGHQTLFLCSLLGNSLPWNKKGKSRTSLTAQGMWVRSKVGDLICLRAKRPKQNRSNTVTNSIKISLKRKGLFREGPPRTQPPLCPSGASCWESGGSHCLKRLTDHPLSSAERVRDTISQETAGGTRRSPGTALPTTSHGLERILRVGGHCLLFVPSPGLHCFCL